MTNLMLGAHGAVPPAKRLGLWKKPWCSLRCVQCRKKMKVMTRAIARKRNCRQTNRKTNPASDPDLNKLTEAVCWLETNATMSSARAGYNLFKFYGEKSNSIPLIRGRILVLKSCRLVCQAYYSNELCINWTWKLDSLPSTPIFNCQNRRYCSPFSRCISVGVQPHCSYRQWTSWEWWNGQMYD